MNAVQLKQQTEYQIKVQGLLKESWSVWLDAISVSFNDEANRTSISVVVPDQAALRGILNKLWDLNLTIISVKAIND